MTPFDEEIAAGIAAGELCPKPLAHGDPCGRKIHAGFKIGLCKWHSEDELGIKHADDGIVVSPPKKSSPSGCIDCHIRPIIYRNTKRCLRCHKAHWRKMNDVGYGVIVGDL